MEVEPRQLSGAPEAPIGASRRSGRVVRAPEKYAPQTIAIPAKRQRTEDLDGEDVENEVPEDDESDDADAVGEEDEVEDGDHVAPAKRKGKKRVASQSAGGKKPAAKKPKINGDVPGGDEHVTSLARRPKKGMKIDVGERGGEGLYGMIS
jgi:cohesin complex subunit SA-1/2